MTPEERFARIEQTLAEMAESQKDFQKRHDEATASHASWLQDHERWMREMEVLHALTEQKLQDFVDSLRKGGNGRPPQ